SRCVQSFRPIFPRHPQPPNPVPPENGTHRAELYPALIKLGIEYQLIDTSSKVVDVVHEHVAGLHGEGNQQIQRGPMRHEVAGKEGSVTVCSPCRLYSFLAITVPRRS